MAGANGGSRWTDALLDPMRELGDPLADGPVAAVLERGGVDPLLDDAIDAPANDDLIGLGLVAQP